MKIKREVEIDICDVCKTGEKFISFCLGCGKAVCWDCKEKGEIESFQHSVNCSGSGDGDFCPACLAKPPEKIRPLLTVYFRIRALRNEARSEYDDFRKRCEKAEADLKLLQKANQ